MSHRPGHSAKRSTSQPKRRLFAGFTIVELLVVIVVIGILAAVVIVSYGSWKQNTLSTQVRNDLSQAATAMESAKNFSNGYPTNGTIPSTFKASNGVTIGWTFGDTSSYCLDGSSTSNPTITYYVTNSSGGPQQGTCNDVNSEDAPDPPTSPTSSVSGTTITVNWTDASDDSIDNYEVQCAQDQGYVTGLLTATVDDTQSTATMTGAHSAATYFCEVRSQNDDAVSAWVSAPSTSTFLAAPANLRVTSETASSIAIAWDANPDATSYIVQQTDSTYTQDLSQLPAQPTTTASFTGLTTSTNYYFRVEAIGSGLTSGWSTVHGITIAIGQPGTPTCTTASDTEIDAAWTSASNATTYRLDYSTDSSFGTYSSIDAISGLSQAITGLKAGTTYYCRVLGEASGNLGPASGISPAATTTISPATSVSISASIPGGVRAYSAGSWVYWPSGDAKSGNWYYAQATMHATCASSTAHYKITAHYNSDAASGQSDTTTATWYMLQPTSGSSLTFSMYAWCKGGNLSSSNSSTHSASVSN